MKEVLLLLVMFWNVENFFDPFDQTGMTGDHDFTPRGKNFWTWKKFVKKRDDLAKVILLSREEYGVYPAMIGLCEVENWFVLNQLVTQTPLARIGYKVIHKDSPDHRGIDVALLYNPAVVKVLTRRFFPVRTGGDKVGDSILKSRLILYMKGIVNGLDTVHCFVNHWPSKLGGEKVSLPNRMFASNMVKMKTDSILAENDKANVIVMGDLNDRPDSKPVKNLNRFMNLTNNLLADCKKTGWPLGTHKYKERWEFIDQFLVSENLAPGYDSIIGNRFIYCKRESMCVFAPNYLIDRDEQYLGTKLRRTLSGPRYLGGVSDHLPVVLKVYGLY
ncbi:MAG: hypothetical protein RR555_08415 [Bacteroidales bacterium]